MREIILYIVRGRFIPDRAMNLSVAGASCASCALRRALVIIAGRADLTLGLGVGGWCQFIVK